MRALSSDVKNITTRMDEGIEKVMGVMSSKIGPMSANLQSTMKTASGPTKTVPGHHPKSNNHCNQNLSKTNDSKHPTIDPSCFQK